MVDNASAQAIRAAPLKSSDGHIEKQNNDWSWLHNKVNQLHDTVASSALCTRCVQSQRWGRGASKATHSAPRPSGILYQYLGELGSVRLRQKFSTLFLPKLMDKFNDRNS